MEQRLDMLATKRKEPNSTFSPSPTSTRCCDGELDVYQATQGHTVLSPRSSTRTSLKIVTASLTTRARRSFVQDASSGSIRQPLCAYLRRCAFMGHSSLNSLPSEESLNPARRHNASHEQQSAHMLPRLPVRATG